MGPQFPDNTTPVQTFKHVLPTQIPQFDSPENSNPKGIAGVQSFTINKKMS